MYKDDEQFHDFVVQSLTIKTFNKKMYFGYILKDLSDRIKTETGIDTYLFNCSLSSNEIRKIIKDHGDITKELPRGQRNINAEDFLLFPQVLAFPEKIRLSDPTKKNKPVLRFEKNINGKYTVVTVKSDKHKDLFIQTAYIGMKKGTLAAGIDEQASINTSETLRGTDSSLSSILPQPEKNVKPRSENSSNGIPTAPTLTFRKACDII